MCLQDYVTLARSGLRVSSLSLGTMTFGTEWGWGSEEAQAREIFDRYVDQAGNFVDTANMYTGGKSGRINKPPRQVALNWVITQPGVTSTIIGATKPAQLNDTLQAADITIPAELRKRLDEVSAQEAIQPVITGGTAVRKWTPAQVSGAPSRSAAASKAQAAGDK
jgi:aryl-alcohol dehydrogenase-like predicted oxidoreductase